MDKCIHAHLTLPQSLHCSLSIAHFELSESLNQFSQLSIQATSVQELDFISLIGQQGLFSIQAVSADVVGLGASLPLRTFHGQVFSCERLSHSADEITYRLILSNRFSTLNQYYTSRLFQNQNVPDIVASLLRKHGYTGNDFRFLLSRSYPIREYVTQYDENDAHFIQRLCEEEGIWFYFAQSDERDVWIFADDVVHYQRHLPAYPFRENAGLESVGVEAVSVLQLKQQSMLSQVRVDDYNYRTADRDLSAKWQNPAVSGVSGSLNARVVSPDNYTYAYIDDMGRYRVKLPFDLDEWSPGGDSRPVRLAKPYAGPNYGQHFPLHEGTEVMLSFVQGNPDRPYISGVMHDSKNQEHVNNEWNTRNVIRTWANNKLRMEDKQGQEHIKLATDYQKSQLNLGHIVNQTREKRGDNGEGFELRTDGWGSVRANKGLLLTSYGQQGAQGNVLNMDETIVQLEQALALAKSLNKAAKTAQNAETSVKSQQNQLSGSLKDLQQSAIIQTAPNGIASATKQSQLHTAQENIHLISGNETDISAGSNFTVHATQSLNLFAQSEGVKLQANQGKVSIQAQNDEMQINALKDATITSSAGKITIAAKDEILLTSGGAYIKIAHGEVELGMPNICRIRCAGFSVTGAKSFNHMNLPLFEQSKQYALRYQMLDTEGNPFKHTEYIAYLKDAQIHQGTTDEEGFTEIFYASEQENIKIQLLYSRYLNIDF